MLEKLMPKSDEFFDDFDAQADATVRGAKLLRDLLDDFTDIERKVARCRILLSLFAMAAIYADPVVPILLPDVRFEGATFRVGAQALTVLGAYLGYSLAVYGSLVIGLVPRGIVAITTWADILFGALIALSTQGAASPFYVFFAFAVIALTAIPVPSSSRSVCSAASSSGRNTS